MSPGERAMWATAWGLLVAAFVLLALGITRHSAAFDFGAFLVAVESIAFGLGALSYE